jgi:hypothetical protein
MRKFVFTSEQFSANKPFLTLVRKVVLQSRRARGWRRRSSERQSPLGMGSIARFPEHVGARCAPVFVARHGTDGVAFERSTGARHAPLRGTVSAGDGVLRSPSMVSGAHRLASNRASIPRWAWGPSLGFGYRDDAEVQSAPLSPPPRLCVSAVNLVQRTGRSPLGMGCFAYFPSPYGTDASPQGAGDRQHPRGREADGDRRARGADRLRRCPASRSWRRWRPGGWRRPGRRRDRAWR